MIWQMDAQSSDRLIKLADTGTLTNNSQISFTNNATNMAVLTGAGTGVSWTYTGSGTVNFSDLVTLGKCDYQVDMVGANRVGMKGVLLDREGYNAEVTDCPRVQSLSELVEHL